MPGLRGAAIVDFSAMARAFSSIKIPGGIPGSSRVTGNIEPLVTIGSRGNLTQGRRAREFGFTIDDVRTLLGLADASADTCAEAETIARAQLDQIRHKIAERPVPESPSRSAGPVGLPAREINEHPGSGLPSFLRQGTARSATPRSTTASPRPCRMSGPRVSPPRTGSGRGGIPMSGSRS